MSRGLGVVQRAIAATFKDRPSEIFTQNTLAMIAYPGINRPAKKHLVAASRAASGLIYPQALEWLVMGAV